MLVLTRLVMNAAHDNRGKSDIVIVTPTGERIVVSLLEVDRGKARIGFDAPPDFKIYRQELLDADRQRDDETTPHDAAATGT